MYLLDSSNQIVDSELSLDLLNGEPCIVVESSGGANQTLGIKRRNPEYNRLLSLLLERFAFFDVKITKVILDSKKLADIPVAERITPLGLDYPVDLAGVDIESFRKLLQRQIAAMHRAPSAKSGGNAQRRIRICLDRPISADRLISPLGHEATSSDIPLYAPGLTETERDYVSKGRLGQGQFRKDLLEAYGGACPVTGIEHPDLLVASHIKPWKACSNAERLDPQNGILLSALVDRLFDRGLITFSSDGRIIFSPIISPCDRARIGLDDVNPLRLSERSRHYMHYHRSVEFKSN